MFDGLLQFWNVDTSGVRTMECETVSFGAEIIAASIPYLLSRDSVGKMDARIDFASHSLFIPGMGWGRSR